MDASARATFAEGYGAMPSESRLWLMRAALNLVAGSWTYAEIAGGNTAPGLVEMLERFLGGSGADAGGSGARAAYRDGLGPQQFPCGLEVPFRAFAICQMAADQAAEEIAVADHGDPVFGGARRSGW